MTAHIRFLFWQSWQRSWMSFKADCTAIDQHQSAAHAGGPAGGSTSSGGGECGSRASLQPPAPGRHERCPMHQKRSEAHNKPENRVPACRWLQQYSLSACLFAAAATHMLLKALTGCF